MPAGNDQLSGTRTWARKRSTRAVLPIPVSPEINTVWRSPRRARANASCSRSSSSPRPTKGGGQPGLSCEGFVSFLSELNT